mgnify:CR=1 FL=1
MHIIGSIKPVGKIFNGKLVEMPEKSGAYAFWWIADRQILMSGNQHIVLKGPGERPDDLEYLDWWPAELEYPCLYVGKTTNLKKRFSLHIMGGSSGRLHEA